MRFGRGRINWYDLIFIGLAAMAVYPDKVLDWASGITGKKFGWRHLIALELIILGLLTLTMHLLMPHYPKLQWWYPLIFIGILTLVRGIQTLVVGMFGFGD
jgi:hypothetical protein